MLTPEHRAQRIGRITSSIIPAIMGLDSYTTLRQAKAKINGTHPFVTSDAIERGNFLEKPLLERAAKMLAFRLEMPGFKALGDIFGDSVDGIFYDGKNIEALGEAKTAAGFAAKEWGEDGTSEVPDKVRVQCLWHLLHYPEAERCYVPFMGDHAMVLRMYFVDWDDAAIKMIQEQGRAFHEKYIRDDETPPAEAGDEPDVRAAFPTETEGMLTNDPAIDGLVWEIKNLELELGGSKMLDAKLRGKKTQLREALGVHEGAIGAGYKVSYKQTKDRAKVDWKGVAAEIAYPDRVLQNHTKIVPGSRTLRLTIK